MVVKHMHIQLVVSRVLFLYPHHLIDNSRSPLLYGNVRDLRNMLPKSSIFFSLRVLAPSGKSKVPIL